VVLGDISSGAANDLQKATEIAFKMAAHFGMSERVGPVYHEHRTEHPFLGQTLATEGGTSDATVHVIEQETRNMLAAAVDEAAALLDEKHSELERLVATLLEQETVERAELERILGPSITAPGAVPAEPLHAGANGDANRDARPVGE
jgi:cell division protease FtsH